MTRQIKFRGKRIDNGEWVYGFIVITSDKAFILNDVGGFNYEVDPATVGQFIEHHNCHEGDIMKREENSCNVPFLAKYEAVFIEDAFCLKVIESKIFRPDSIIHTWGNLEIIGNIHEHSHLIQTERTK